MKKLLILTAAALALLAAPVASFAQFPSWTSVCSAGIIDEASTPVWTLGGPGGPFSSLSMPGPGLGFVTARYNITNTAFPPSPVPLWDTLELGYFDSGGGLANDIVATLYKVWPCSGLCIPVCSVTSRDNPSPTCVTCAIPPGTFNFTTNLYFVDVTINRGLVGGFLAAHTLRIYDFLP